MNGRRSKRAHGLRGDLSGDGVIELRRRFLTEGRFLTADYADYTDWF
jgi:hypothetical protein